MDDFEKRTREAAGDFQRSNGLAIYTDVYTSFVDGAYWARDEMQDEIDRLKRDNDLLYRAKELYGPTGFRHVGSIMNERDRLKAELAAARGEIATLKWHIGNVEGCGKLVVKECEDLKLLLAKLTDKVERYADNGCIEGYSNESGLGDVVDEARAALNEESK